MGSYRTPFLARLSSSHPTIWGHRPEARNSNSLQRWYNSPVSNFPILNFELVWNLKLGISVAKYTSARRAPKSQVVNLMRHSRNQSSRHASRDGVDHAEHDDDYALPRRDQSNQGTTRLPSGAS